MYDVVIIGGGIAGLTSAIYTKRYELKTLVIMDKLGGILYNVADIENFPGFKKISGQDLLDKTYDQAKSLGIEFKESEAVEAKKIKDKFQIKTKDNTKFEGKTIIFATGSKRRKLNVPGEKEFFGKGVSYCATCDGAFFKDKVVGVVGGSDSAAREALILAQYAKKVYIIYRKEKIRAEPINNTRVKKNKKIEIIPNTNITDILGDKFVNHVKFDTGKEMDIDGLFIEIGFIPNNELAKQLGVKLDDRGEIIIDKQSKTNIEGVYACGDITSNVYKQAVVGCGEGAMAGWSAYNYVMEKE